MSFSPNGTKAEDPLDPNYQPPDIFRPQPNINPRLFGPLVGIPNTGTAAPEYLDYNVAGRSWNERMVYNTGTSYLIGIVLGGSYGVVDGFRNAPSTKFNIRLNSVLNKSGRGGSRLGNALGSVAFIYSLFEGLCEYSDLERRAGGMEWITPVVSATATGVFYKGTMGPKTFALAGAFGAAIATTSYFARRAFPHVGSSKRLLFF